MVKKTASTPSRITYTEDENAPFSSSQQLKDMWKGISGLQQEKDTILKNLQKLKPGDPYYNSNKIYLTNQTADLDKQIKEKKKAYDKQAQEEKQQYQTRKQFTALGNQAKQNADRYRMMFPSIIDAGMATARNDARRAQAAGTANVRAGYNNRGLLYSGLRAGSEADVGADVSNQLNAIRAQANQAALDKQNELDQAPLDIASAKNQYETNIANTDNAYTRTILDALMQKQNAQTQSIADLIGAGSQLAGTIGGGLIKTPTLFPPDYFSSQFPSWQRV